MTNAREKYEAALAAFATPGERWASMPALTYWGKASGLSAEQIVADAHAVGVTNRDGSIRSGWDTAKPKFIDGLTTAWSASRTPPSPPKPKPHPSFVRDLLGDIDSIKNLRSPGACPESLLAVSPCDLWFDLPEHPALQSYLFMRALYRPDELVHVMTISNPSSGRMGENIRPAKDWLEIVRDVPGDGLVLQPLTGRLGATADGRPSYISNDCIADYPFAVIEFDDLKYAFDGDEKRGLAAQFRLWSMFFHTCKHLRSALVAVTHSGGKSLHAILHVGARTETAWNAARDRLVALFASDPTSMKTTKDGRPVVVYPFRCDVQALRPRQGTRLAGARRRDNGRVQGLYYLNPDARLGNMWDKV